MRLFAPLALAAVLFIPALAEDPNPALFEEVWQKTAKNFYDRKMNGKDWKAIRKQYEPLAAEAKTQEELIGVINRMLGELKVSHLVLIGKEAYEEHFAPEMGGAAVPQVGFEAVKQEGSYWVRNVLEGGAAEKAGIRRGDRLVSVNGVAPEESELLEEAGSDPGLPWPPMYYVRAEGKKTAKLVVERTKGKTLALKVKPEPITMIEASANSVKVIEHEGMKFGYVHTWHFLVTGIYGTVSKAMKGEFSQCDGLLLDIRGRGGSPFVMNAILGLFRTGAWDRPVVLLIDDRSRSAKELFAWSFMRENLGCVVGRRTEGAVLGSTFFPLSDGSCLLIPIQDGRFFTKNEATLEGNGVTPHLIVDHDLPFCDGYDEILEAGKLRLELEVRHVRRKAAGTKQLLLAR